MANLHMWGDGTIRKLDRFCKSVRATPTERSELLAHWRAQYLADREAYLATLPDLSRMGRLIWIHARRARNAEDRSNA